MNMVMRAWKDDALDRYQLEEETRAIGIMSGEIQRLSRSKSVNAEELQALNSFLSTLCQVISEAASSEMKQQYIELANMIRMLRDDLDRIMERACA